MAKNKLGAAAGSAGKADPTGKYTLNGWGQTEADFAFFDLAQDKVELKSDGWRTAKIADDPNVKVKDAAVGTALHELLFAQQNVIGRKGNRDE